MRYIVIGDIHGCVDELFDLINLLKPTKEDHIISAGDLIHKGPSGSEVVKLFRDYLPTLTNTSVVLGNHDEKHIRWAKSDKKNKFKHTEDYTNEHLSSDLLDYLDNLPTHISFAHYLVTHAGIPGNLRLLPNKTKPWSSYTNHQRDEHNSIMRIRFQTPDGGMVHMGEEQPEDHYWAESYDGRFGLVIFGHHVFKDVYHIPQPKIYKHAIGIDTGCVHGGHLMAFIYDTETGHSFVSVPARKQYAPFISLMTREP